MEKLTCTLKKRESFQMHASNFLFVASVYTKTSTKKTGSLGMRLVFRCLHPKALVHGWGIIMESSQVMVSFQSI